MENLILSHRLYQSIANDWIDVKITTKEGKMYHSDMRLRFSITNTHDANLSLDEVKKPIWGNYFDLRKGETSYHSGQQNLNENGQWIREGRQVCKVSKLLAYIISQNSDCVRFDDYVPVEMKDKMIKRFVELISTNTKKTGSEILVSDDVAGIYQLPTSYESTGTLGNSCMRPESDYSCHDQVSFYNAIEACIAYTLDKDGRLTSRALLWKDCKSDKGLVFSYIDRIYGTELAIAEMKEWAHENGFAHKQEQSYNDCTLIMPDGKKISDFVYSKETCWDNGFPFIDTMKWLSENCGIMSLSSWYCAHSCELQNTNGDDPREYDEELEDEPEDNEESEPELEEVEVEA